MAAFCLSTGIPPSEAKQLTRLERDAFYDVIKRSKRGR